MIDHSECTEVTYEEDGQQWRKHECPPCPHGLIGGIARQVGRGEDVDAADWRSGMRTVDALSCDDESHAAAIERGKKLREVSA